MLEWIASEFIVYVLSQLVKIKSSTLPAICVGNQQSVIDYIKMSGSES